jgi:hypothetical protein
MGGNAGSSKAQVKSASFVLRKLVHYFIENYDWALTKELSDGIIMTMKQSRIFESDYIETVRFLFK